jgi:dipeptidyl aminopeptidase/acylaminoacyl peptidase
MTKEAERAASPLTHAHKTHFPVLLLHGATGDMHLPKDAAELEKELREKGAEVRSWSCR